MSVACLQVEEIGGVRLLTMYRIGARPEKAGRIARNTLAVFTQPNLWEKVDGERDFAALGQFIINQNL